VARSRHLLPGLLLAIAACTDLRQAGISVEKSGRGLVVDASGQPVAGVKIRVFPIIPDLARLISERQSGLETGTPVDLISNNAAGYVLDSRMRRRTQAAIEVLETDPSGEFPLASLSTGNTFAIEAIRTTTIKACAQNVPAGVASLKLVLAPTGGVTGTVITEATGSPDVLGTVVGLPGTDYLTTTDASGTYLIPELPGGTFDLVAIHPRLGRGFQLGIEVRAGRVTTALPLTLKTPAR